MNVGHLNQNTFYRPLNIFFFTTGNLLCMLYSISYIVYRVNCIVYVQYTPGKSNYKKPNEHLIAPPGVGSGGTQHLSAGDIV